MKTLSFLTCLGLATLSLSASAQKSTHRRHRTSTASGQIASVIPGAAAHVGPATYLPTAATASTQKILSLQEHNYIGSYRMTVGFQKTTHLIFPYAVSYVDLGNGGIIADKARGAENIVKVKASQ